jgi:hypothetical protein
MPNTNKKIYIIYYFYFYNSDFWIITNMEFVFIKKNYWNGENYLRKYLNVGDGPPMTDEQFQFDELKVWMDKGL